MSEPRSCLWCGEYPCSCEFSDEDLEDLEDDDPDDDDDWDFYDPDWWESEEP